MNDKFPGDLLEVGTIDHELFIRADNAFDEVYPEASGRLQSLTSKHGWAPTYKSEFPHLGIFRINYIYKLASRVQDPTLVNSEYNREFVEAQSKVGIQIGHIGYSRVTTATDLAEEFSTRRLLLSGRSSGFEMIYAGDKLRRIVLFKVDPESECMIPDMQIEIDDAGSINQMAINGLDVIPLDVPEDNLKNIIDLYQHTAETALMISFG